MIRERMIRLVLVLDEIAQVPDPAAARSGLLAAAVQSRIQFSMSERYFQDIQRDVRLGLLTASEACYCLGSII